MTLQPDKLIEDYLNWLRERISFKDIPSNEEGVKIASIDSPFLDTHNDYLRIYVVYNEKSDSYKLTDDGMTYYDLKTNNLELTENRKDILSQFINGLGVRFDNDTSEIFIECKESDLAKSKHKLIQAMINIGDMFILSKPYVKALFFEDVANFFAEHSIPATRDVTIEGKGFSNKIDFVIPSRKKEENEKIVKVINSPSNTGYRAVLFTLSDIRGGATVHASADQFVIINDQERKVSPDDLKKFETYSVKTLLWSEREESVEIFN
ncbi:DUF1828 domain-containing protein [Candidatus Woesearchaeota archaeon]|nr:DUF1828 domain-containing protein [Candidatus Woesearchaeota archaeon]